MPPRGMPGGPPVRPAEPSRIEQATDERLSRQGVGAKGLGDSQSSVYQMLEVLSEQVQFMAQGKRMTPGYGVNEPGADTSPVPLVNMPKAMSDPYEVKGAAKYDAHEAGARDAYPLPLLDMPKPQASPYEMKGAGYSLQAPDARDDSPLPLMQMQKPAGAYELQQDVAEAKPAQLDCCESLAGLMRELTRVVSEGFDGLGVAGGSGSVVSDRDAMKAIGKGGAIGAVDKDSKDGGMLAGLAGAATGVVGTFNQATGAAKGFVEAFAPSTVLVFQQALGDLAAVIGSALEPVIQSATEIVKDFSSVLLPLMRDLRPVIEQVTGALGEVAKVLISSFAVTMKALAPVIKLVADLFVAMTPIFQAASAAIAGAVEALKYIGTAIMEALGADLSDVGGRVRDAMESVAEAALVASAALLKLINAGLGDAFIKGVQNALGANDTAKARKELDAFGGGPLPKQGVEREDATGMKAMTNARFVSIGDFGKQVALAAAVAGGGGGRPKTSEEWLAKISSSLDKLNGLDREAVWKWIKDAIADGIRQGLTGTAYNAKDAAYQALGGMGLGVYADVFDMAFGKQELTQAEG